MEPQLFSRGNMFDGSNPTFKTELQWSRSFSAAEIMVRIGMGVSDIRASMEPQLFSRGNGVDMAALFETFALQWSRSFSAAEIGLSSVIDRKAACFNGAAAFQPRKFCQAE